MDRNTFYLCWIPGKSYSTPHVKHATRETAEEEAKRLTAKTRKECYILEATHVIVPPKEPAPTVHRLLQPIYSYD